MLELSLKLILAHVIGDFLFQSDKSVSDKKANKIKSKYLYFHVLIHGIALIICLLPSASYWAGILVILVTHFVIDLVKLSLLDKICPRKLFVADQMAHLLVIALVVKFYEPYKIDFETIAGPQTLLLLISLLVCTHVTSITMRLLLSRWQEELAGPENSAGNGGMALKDAGNYIGILERLFIFFFVISQQLSGIGFLLASKSIFRFGDLGNAKDRKLTEYILIGTLLSFGFAILTAKGYLYLNSIIQTSN